MIENLSTILTFPHLLYVYLLNHSVSTISNSNNDKNISLHTHTHTHARTHTHTYIALFRYLLKPSSIVVPLFCYEFFNKFGCQFFHKNIGLLFEMSFYLSTLGISAFIGALKISIKNLKVLYKK